MGNRSHQSVFPGFREMASRRQSLASELTKRRVRLGLSQTEVAARMGTSQSAVARLESGSSDLRLSTLERYAAAVDRELDWRLQAPGPDHDG
ncbi:MAG: helix-turn-helix domain-containing protein [Candidatus Dormibacteria bacterium]